MAITVKLKRNLSESSTPLNGVLRGIPYSTDETHSVSDRIYWRFEDDVDMPWQFLTEGILGQKIFVPFPSEGRDIVLSQIAFTETGQPTDHLIREGEQIVVAMGASNSRTLFDHWTDISTTGSGDETLHVYRIEAGKFGVNGDKIKAEYSGVKTNAGNKFRLHCNSTIVFSTDDFPDSTPGGDRAWTMDVTIMRKSASVLRFKTTFQTFDTDNKQELPWPAYYELTGLDLDGRAYNLEMTGEGATDEVTLKMAYGEKKPAATANTGWWLDEDGMPILDEDGDQIEEG